MLFDSVNIVKKLDEQRSQNTVLKEAKSILSEEFLHEIGIFDRLDSQNQKGDYPDISLLNESRVYSLNEIENVCIKYRLRFLDTAFFRGNIPTEAINKIKEIENKTGVDLKELHIVAPSRRFKLEDCDKDPLLFAHIGNNQFYLIHKWGRDLSWFRKFLVYPLRSIETFAVSLITLAAIIAVVTPDDLLSLDPVALDIPYLRIAWFLKALIALGSISALILAAFHKSFSSAQWKDNLFKR